MHLWVLMYCGNTAIYRCLLAVPAVGCVPGPRVNFPSTPGVLDCTLCHGALHCTAPTQGALFCTVLYCNVLHFTALYSAVPFCTSLYCTVLHCTVLGGGGDASCGPGLPLLLGLSCDRFYINQMYCLSIADLYIFYWSFIKLIHFIYNLFNFQVLYRVILKNMIFIKVFWFKWSFWFIESFSGILVLKWLIGVKSTEIVQIWSLNYVKWFSIFNWS